MPGKRVSTARWVLLLVMGLVSVLLLACIVPSALTRSNPTPVPTPTAEPSPTPSPLASRQPGAPAVTQITEPDMNDWLKGVRAPLGEGIECRDMQARIRSTGLILSATVRAAQFRDTPIPVEIEVKPVVRGQRLEMQVLDVRLGGSYAGLSSIVKPLVTAGIAQSFDANSFLAEHGMRIVSLELHDGYMIITSEPTTP